MSKKSISILWGAWPRQKADTYTFETWYELDAFMLGLEEGNGWQEYAIVKEEGDEDA